VINKWLIARRSVLLNSHLNTLDLVVSVRIQRLAKLVWELVTTEMCTFQMMMAKAMTTVAWLHQVHRPSLSVLPQVCRDLAQKQHQQKGRQWHLAQTMNR